MLLQDFFKNISSPEFVFAQEAKIFYGPEFPSLFFTILKDKLKQQTNNTIYFLDIKNLEQSSIKSTLETSFLGSSSVYWLGDLTLLSEQDTKFWLNYFKDYSGPHTVLFFISDTNPQLQQLLQNKSKEQIFVKLEPTIDKNSYINFYKFFLNQNIDPSFVENLFSARSLIPLDIASILFNYQSLLGKKHEAFFSDWADKIVISEKSLFTLSQHFFAKNNTQFFELWAQVKDTYPDEFWVAYWSDQLWNAIFYIQYMRANMTKEAKYINRLPFAFIQKDWKKCAFYELQTAHEFLYQIDYGLKNGTATNGIDLWLFKYFNNQFLSKN